MMTPTTIEPMPPDVPPPPARRGLGRLLLGVVLWPRSTFGYLRDHGARSWLFPLLLVMALAAAARAVAIPIEKAQAAAALAALQAQLNAQGQGTNVKGNLFISAGPGGPIIPGMADPNSNPLLAYGLPVVGVAGDWLLRGAVLLGLAWLLGGRPVPGAMFRLSGWTLLPNAARLLVAMAVMVIAHHEPAAGLNGFGAGPATFVVSGDSATATSGNSQSVQGIPRSTSAPTFFSFLRTAFLGALDLYTFWGLALMLIGVAVTAQIGWLKAAISTLGYWALSLVLTALPPLLSFFLLTLARPGNTIVGP
jgi:hypothetical protein